MLNYFFRSATDWLFRRRSIGYSLVRLGVPLLAVLLVGFTVGIRIPTSWGPVVFDLTTAGDTPAAIGWTIACIAVGVLGVGLWLIASDANRDGRSRVIVVEARGLRDWQGSPLEQAVPPSILGRREQVVVDVRQGLVDGQLVEPVTALRHVMSLPIDLARRSDGLDRRDITYVVGGLAPVPLLFLLGIVVDDEGTVVFMDWDRHYRTWRGLDADDDLKRFTIDGLDSVPDHAPRVALCISASYDVLEADVALVEPHAPVVRMELKDRGTDAHWSEAKQQALGRQFLEVVMKLAANGAKEIALFLAAPASLALRFGALYDKRNLPSIEVNQYERGNSKVFPWAIRMPVSGQLEAEVLER